MVFDKEVGQACGKGLYFA